MPLVTLTFLSVYLNDHFNIIKNNVCLKEEAETLDKGHISTYTYGLVWCQEEVTSKELRKEVNGCTYKLS